VVVPFLAACSGGPSDDGPLRMGGDWGTLCVPAPSWQPVTVGFDVMTNEGDSLLTVEEVSLVDAEGLSIEAAYLIELGEDDGAIGVWSEFPPESDEGETDGAGWRSRVEAAGSEVLPGARLNLVVGLKPTADVAASKGVEVVYVAESGRTFVERTTTEIELAVGAESCP
jgi:hypothetical protein